MNKISIFSFFSGAGLLDLAFEKNNYNIVFVNEYNENFLTSYIYSRQQMGIEMPAYGCSTKSAVWFSKGKGKRKLREMIEIEKSKGNLVGFIGGPPCPDFSIGGKNAGAKGENGKLTKTYFDLICRCRPDFFLFENVKGLFRTAKHRSFYNEMTMKIKANNYIISDKLLNSLNYAVPQSRERIFMIGMQAKHIKSIINIEKTFDFDWEKYHKFDDTDISRYIWPTQQRFLQNSKRKFKYDAPKELTVEFWFQKNDVFNHPNGCDVFKVKQGKAKINTYPEGDTQCKSFKRLHRWRYSPTAAYGNNEMHLHPYKPRRLSVAEVMAIQSLPPSFCLPSDSTLSSKFKMIGNGVPFLLADAIARTLKDYISQEDYHV